MVLCRSGMTFRCCQRRTRTVRWFRHLGSVARIPARSAGAVVSSTICTAILVASLAHRFASSLLDWVRLFFVEEFSPYSWAFLPADASLQCSFRGDSNQASAYPRLSGGQPSLETVPNTVGLSPSGALPSGHSRGVLVRCRGKGGRPAMAVTTGFQGRTFDVARTGVPCIDLPSPSPVRSGRCCLRGCQSLPLVQRSPADERERTRTGTAPAAPGFGTQAPARTSRPTQPERGCWSGRGHQRCRVLGAARARKPRRNDLRHDAGCGSGLRAARSRRLASARCRAEPAAGALLGRDAPPRDHRDRLAGTTAYALEATVVLDIIHVAAATRRAVLVVGSSKGLSAFGPRPDGSRPAHGDTWLQLRRFSAAAGSRSLDAY